MDPKIRLSYTAEKNKRCIYCHFYGRNIDFVHSYSVSEPL